MTTVYSDGSWRVRVGTWDISDLTSAYEWSAFPQQSDQPDFLTWQQPVDPSGAISEVVELVDALDGSRGGLGGYNGRLHFAPMTPGMIKYIRSAIFAGGFSQDVTMMVWSRSEGWLVLNCKLLWNEPAQSATPGGLRGYLDLTLNWINGTTALVGNGYLSENGLQFVQENGDYYLQE